MSAAPMIGFAAYSGTGKTTLLEKVIVKLKARGLRLGVLKHDAHDFDIDHEGKDSWRFQKAGADITLIASATKMALIEQRPRTFEENIAMLHDVDLILIEGYKQESLPRIGICRAATDKGLPGEVTDYAAVVTDDETIAAQAQEKGIPHFELNDVHGVTAFILKTAGIG